ncbi:MAG: hypothetical protein K5799_05295 [Erythrobacter sp.]|nr:hypothetical protein [Erythrobacter sp.]
MSHFLEKLAGQRRKFLEGLDANEGDINLDIFEDFYPDQAHFVFELLQNAEDVEATEVTFTLSEDGCIFEHDGKRLFSEADVRAITGIHNSTKNKATDQIGKFGVGFKSVFVYSVAPEITSGDFAFRISRLVMPEPIARPDLDRSITRFWLPFNNPKKDKSEAFAEVANGLRELAETTLLFLSSINAINWKINQHETGSILRVEHSSEHVEVLKETDGAKTASSHFLRFNAPVEGLERHQLAVAFALEGLTEGKGFDGRKALAEQFKIVPVAGQVAVFFPAEKETSGLRFHLHAPFVPELSRASIKSTAANEPLFAQLAVLAANAMHGIRDLGLLTPEFLGVLPNPQDVLGKRYEQIRIALIAAFNGEPLMPTHAKDHAPARKLLQAKASLKDLLKADDLEFLIEYDEVPPCWAANRALQGTNVERFMNGLAIGEWDVSEFLEHVSDQADEEWGDPDADFMAWFSGKPVEWLQQFYALLAREPESADDLYQLRDARLVRLSDGALTTGVKSYFPDEERRYTHIVACVDPAVYESGKSKVQQKFARKFLEEVGVREIGERELVKSLLEKEYVSDDHRLKQKEYVAHLRRFIKLIDADASLKNQIKSFKIFLGSDGKWHKPTDIILDLPFLDTGLEKYYEIIGKRGDATPLAALYQSLPIDTPKVVELAKALGAVTTIKVSKARCQSNPKWNYLRSAPGQRWTSTGRNEDYVIEKFDHLVAAKSIRIARLIWNSLNDQGPHPSWLKARFQWNYTNGYYDADSQLVCQLRNSAWVPQMDGGFVKPNEARAELLPEGFVFDPGLSWLKRIEFGKAVEAKNEQARLEAAVAAEKKSRKISAAAELGFEKPEDIEWLEKFAEVPAEDRERLLDEWQSLKTRSDLPVSEPRNPERRAEKVGEIAATAPERKTEMRTRSVSVGREDVKDEAGQYLRQQYTNDGELFCQVCKRRMPFRLDDASAYFERVEFLPSLQKRYHQNYLALCPTDAAKFRFANGTDDMLLDLFCDLDSEELEVILAQNDETIYFTKTHLADLKKVIEVDRRSSTDITQTDGET